MYYFLPTWQTDIIPWYWMSHRLEFDDTIHQIRIFQEEKAPTCILLTQYAPQIRYFLHRQDIFETDLYSVFDEMQQIKETLFLPLQLKDLTWPEDCEFIYTPFLILVRRQGQVYAHINMGAEGFISEIRFFEMQEISKVMILDDRGFVSSYIYYRENQPYYQEYLNPDGVWVFREHFSRQAARIEVNPVYASNFERLVYDSMDTLIREKLTNYFWSQLQYGATFVVSYSQANCKLFEYLPKNSPKIMTIYSEKHQELDMGTLAELLPRLNVLVVDTQDLSRRLCEAFPTYPIKYLPPYDTRLRLGASQSRKESKIFYQMGSDPMVDREALSHLLKFMAEHPLLELTVAFYNAEWQLVQEQEEWVKKFLKEEVEEDQFIRDIDLSAGLENALAENMERDYRFEFKNINDENQLIQELELTRLIIDMSQHPNTYTQIAGISAGIPQINRVSSPYVEHLKNGYVVATAEEIGAAIDYYTRTLKNWNDSLVYSVQKISENTGKQFIKKWENWLKEN